MKKDEEFKDRYYDSYLQSVVDTVMKSDPNNSISPPDRTKILEILKYVFVAGYNQAAEDASELCLNLVNFSDEKHLDYIQPYKGKDGVDVCGWCDGLEKASDTILDLKYTEIQGSWPKVVYLKDE